MTHPVIRTAQTFISKLKDLDNNQCPDKVHLASGLQHLVDSYQPSPNAKQSHTLVGALLLSYYALAQKYPGLRNTLMALAGLLFEFNNPGNEQTPKISIINMRCFMNEVSTLNFRAELYHLGRVLGLTDTPNIEGTTLLEIYKSLNDYANNLEDTSRRIQPSQHSAAIIHHLKAAGEYDREHIKEYAALIQAASVHQLSVLSSLGVVFLVMHNISAKQPGFFGSLFSPSGAGFNTGSRIFKCCMEMVKAISPLLNKQYQNAEALINGCLESVKNDLQIVSLPSAAFPNLSLALDTSQTDLAKTIADSIAELKLFAPDAFNSSPVNTA